MQRFEQVPPPPSSNKQVVESRSIAEEEERHGVKGLFKGRAAGRNSLTFQPSRIFFNSVAKTVGRKLPFDYVPRIQLGKRMAGGGGGLSAFQPTDRPTNLFLLHPSVEPAPAIFFNSFRFDRIYCFLQLLSQAFLALLHTSSFKRGRVKWWTREGVQIGVVDTMDDNFFRLRLERKCWWII